MAGLFDLAMTLTLFVVMGWIGLGFFAERSSTFNSVTIRFSHSRLRS